MALAERAGALLSLYRRAVATAGTNTQTLAATRLLGGQAGNLRPGFASSAPSARFHQTWAPKPGRLLQGPAGTPNPLPGRIHTACSQALPLAKPAQQQHAFARLARLVHGTPAASPAAAAGPRKGGALRALLRGGVPLALGAGLGALWVGRSEEGRSLLRGYLVLPVRLWRDVATASAMALDYRSSLQGLPAGSQEREEALSACHWRCADRLQRLCFDNGGIYLKLGQHLAQLDYLVPVEYVETMRRVMLDQCPTSSPAQVREVIRMELQGKTPEELFLWFSPEPVASASLAQVHQARLKDGTLVAVKVQHGHLATTARADIETVRLVVSAVHWLFPTFDYRWLIKEVQESLPQELDFELEARNSGRCADNFRRSRLRESVVVPRVYPELSSRRVLTMEWMDGVAIGNLEAQKGMKLPSHDVAVLVSKAFAEMIFRHGFVHCDPHAANLLVRPRYRQGAAPRTWAQWLAGMFTLGDANEPELVLLDHGLYRTLTPEIRYHYAGLWKSLVLGSAAGIKEHSIGLGAGEDLYTILASTLTLRSWDTLVGGATLEDRLAIPDTQREKEKLKAYAAQYHKEVTELLRRLPRIVLLLLKTNDCLRSVDKALGAPTTTFLITGRVCTQVLQDEDWEGVGSGSPSPGSEQTSPRSLGARRPKTLARRLRNAVEMWEVEFRLLQIQIVSVIFQWYARLTRMLGFAS